MGKLLRRECLNHEVEDVGPVIFEHPVELLKGQPVVGFLCEAINVVFVEV